MKIVILDGYTANPGDLDWGDLTQLGECTLYERTKRSEVVERAKEAEAILTNKTAIGSEEMDQLPQLKYIGVMATGYNIIDIDAAKKRGIVVTNIPEYSTNSVAQMVFAHLLNIAQQVQKHSDAVRKGKWSSSSDFCFWESPLVELHGKKIGIVGLGSIGKAVATIAKAFGMKVAAYSSKSQSELGEIEKMELDSLFASCDIVSLHCPLTKETRNMVDKSRLRLMKKHAILINTGRGPLINEQDLANALNQGEIYAAGLDVLSKEPPKEDNPLLTAKNCFITPHIAWASYEARERLMSILTQNIAAFKEGHPINNVAK